MRPASWRRHKLSSGWRNLLYVRSNKQRGLREFERGRLSSVLIEILVECRRCSSSVKRDVIMILESKIRDSNAHKKIVISTSGFQSGAIEYAEMRLLQSSTETCISSLSVGSGSSSPPPWIDLSEYVGWFTSMNREDCKSFSLIDDKRKDPLASWIQTHINND